MEGKRTTRTAEAGQILEALTNFAALKPSAKILLNELKIMYTNADCLTNKKTDLDIFLQTLINKPDVIVITEINPKKMVAGLQESEFSICGYNMFALNIEKR